ncbi:MAG: 2-phosphosulfolactate phosphatase [Asgard group archaeon]|nr:2-phosphosulfolactate phosphatase [Asgard group archaeon]
MADVELVGNTAGPKKATQTKAIAIIVDTLRASTTIPVLFARGIKEVFVVKTLAEMDYYRKELENPLVVGERNCLPLPSFDFGNSPNQLFAHKKLTQTKALFTSTTGAKRIVDSRKSKISYIGAAINAQAIAKKTHRFILENNLKGDQKIIIIPAFTEGAINRSKITEDQIGGLLIALELCQYPEMKFPSNLKEEMQYLEQLMKENSLEELIKKTDHAKKLAKLGFEKDINFCSQKNELDIVPISQKRFKEGKKGEIAVQFTTKANF